MQKDMTDQELKEAMKTIARVAGLRLSDARIDVDLPAFKAHLSAIETFSAVELALEDEPNPLFRLKKQPPK